MDPESEVTAEDVERARELRAGVATQVLAGALGLAVIVAAAWVARRKGIGLGWFAGASALVTVLGGGGSGAAVLGTLVATGGRIHDSDVLLAVVAGLAGAAAGGVAALAIAERVAKRALVRRGLWGALAGSTLGVAFGAAYGLAFVTSVNQARLPELLNVLPFLLCPALVGAPVVAGYAMTGRRSAG